jgi:rod shape-determining protein MreC
VALRDTVAQAVLQVRSLVQRFSLLLLAVAALGVMVIGRAEGGLVDRSRSFVLDLVAPILSTLAQPVVAFNETVAEVEELANIRAENTRLREENERLLAWQAAARRLDAENRGLRELTHFREGPQARYISARLVGDSGTAFVRSALLDVGRAAGVQRGHAVLSGEGLAGRITEIGENSARVLFLTDFNSRLPVIVERTRERAIMAGDNSPQPRLTLAQSIAGLQPGDRIITSGHGGSFPMGIPVGVVSSFSDGGARVRLFVDYGRLQYVRIADYAGAVFGQSATAPAVYPPLPGIGTRGAVLPPPPEALLLPQPAPAPPPRSR